MTKIENNKFTIRKGFVITVILLVLSNIFFISEYYHLYLKPHINNKQIKISEDLEKEAISINKKIQHEKDINLYLSKYITKNDNITIILKDENNNTIKIYNEKATEKSNIKVSRIIKYQNNNYLLTISKQQDILNIKVAMHFLIFEILIVSILVIAGVFSANFKILGPLSSLAKDLRNYKFGILPKKRKIHSGVDLLQNDVVELVGELEESRKKQSRIIASISHDIKTPLTSILGYSQRLLTNKKLSDETKMKYANTIYSKSLVMKELIEEFDDYLSCNIKDNNNLEKISINSLVEYLNNYYKDELKEKGIEFKIKTNCPDKVLLVNLPKFKRIFSNTIINSIRHLNKEEKIINIYITEEKKYKIKFEIADNGTGCKEDLNNIFEPLFTTDKSRKISGLGLSICKQIVESHQGTIKAQNNKLGGFSIIFYIDYLKNNN